MQRAADATQICTTDEAVKKEPRERQK